MREKPALARKISQLAESQQGYVARQQLLAFGVSDDAIDHRITTGELIPKYAGVYAVGHRSRGPIPIAAAVVLACGDDAVLSHDSAAALWGFGRWPTRQEVIAPHQRRRKGIVSHRSTTLTPDDITVHYGIRVTTPVRTICDIAARRTDDGLLEAVDDAGPAATSVPPPLRSSSTAAGASAALSTLTPGRPAQSSNAPSGGSPRNTTSRPTEPPSGCTATRSMSCSMPRS